jgi:hypothetical protein
MQLGNAPMAIAERAMRTDVVRSDVLRRIRQQPPRAYALNMENGDRIILEHPESIAFDPRNNGSGGSNDF